MTTIRKIVTSKIDGDTADNTSSDEIRPFGETAFYIDTSFNPDKLTLMMFDGIRNHRDSKVLAPGVLWGSSGDGGGGGTTLDTIKLIPDAELYANASTDYHVVVDVIGEGQIGLRAGGTLDSSSVDIVLGGTENHVSISDSSDRVEIKTTDGVVSRTWTFNNSGLTFPDATVQTTAAGNDTLATVTARGATTTASVTVNELITTDVTGATSPVVGFNIAGAPFPEGAGAGLTWTWVSSGPEVTQLIAQGANLIGAVVTQSEYAGTATVIGLPNLGGTLGIELDAVITYSPTNTLTFTSPDYALPAPLPLNLTVAANTWTFGTDGGLTLPSGGIIQETQVTNELWGTTTTSLTLVPSGAANGTQRLEIYATGGGEGDHIHITSGDQNQTDLFLGNDTQYYAVAASGANYIQARSGYASPSPGTSAGPGANVNISAGNAGDNGGNVADGNSGGDVFISSGVSSSGLGGDILINTSSGPDGFGNIELSTDGGSSYWTFNKDNQLVFPNGTIQTAAFTGTSALLDITNTNGIDTNYYITFVENRAAGQEVRADVDLTWNSWSNTLGVGKISVNSTETSTSTVNGSLTVAGGVGVAKDMYVGGVVVQPALPAFRVIGNGGAVSTSTTLTNAHFVVDFNQGNHLNTSTGVFTAPVSGIYSVNLVMRTFSNNNPTINQAIVYKNSSTPILMLEYGVNTTMNHAGVSTIAKLNAGDTLETVVAVGTMSFDSNDNWSIAFLG